jgi:RNA polymerase sigma-70 factor (ECF subfamily)
MYAIEGYKHKEIAELLNISESTSKSQLFKARNILKNELRRIENENIEYNFEDIYLSKISFGHG